MNLIAFSVETTNLFPISNSNAGGQLMTEYNLRSRESVGTDPNIKYAIGPSYTHSLDDFNVTLELDGSGIPISTTAIMISSGRALVNGHYVESLVPIVVDIKECNIQLQREGIEELTGQLCVGLRIMYSTSATMSGAMLVENAAGMYEGVQIVILPKEGALGTAFTLPSDSPTDESLVNAHLKLAEFTFSNGSVSNIIVNEDRTSILPADRLSRVESFISDIYVKKTGLNAKKIYTFSGKGTDPITGLDTWCDSTDSLMIWDAHPTLTSTAGVSSARFVYDPSTDTVKLQIPHKQVDGMEDTYGNPQYYADKLINLPGANYGMETGGVVTKSYTQTIKDIANQIQTFYRLPNGSMKYFHGDILTNRDNLPNIYDNSTWVPGDYVLVAQDATLGISTDGRYPSTMYVVLPGRVLTISYVGYVADPELVPPGLEGGVQLGTATVTDSTFDYSNIPSVSSKLGISSKTFRGTVNTDYFRIAWVQTDGNSTNTFYYFYTVATNDDRVYSEPICVTGQVPLAKVDSVGGFYNINPDDATGGGYVYLDDNGYLRLVDYQWLASGTLAYQFGHDATLEAGSMEEIQTQLDQYVNQRVVFPDSTQIQNYQKYNAENPTNQKIANNIHLYITLPEITSTEGTPVQQEINIFDMDSRFSSSFHIHLSGGNNYNIVNIINCQKVRVVIESGSPIVNLYNSCIYYDTEILDAITEIKDMRLWYDKLEPEDPDIQINGMTVELIGQPTSVTSDEFWSTATPNDNHYNYGLRSITFGPSGDVIGISMLVTDNITGNIADGNYIFATEFDLPQSQSLPYPPNRMTKTLKVAGHFVTAYPINVNEPEGYKVKDNSFTAMTNPYNPNDVGNFVHGTISFLTRVESITNVAGISPTTFIDGWDTNQYYIFSGGAID